MLDQLNPITMSELIANIKDIANSFSKEMKRNNEFRAYVASLTDNDLLLLGFSQESINYIRSFCVALLNMDEAYNNLPKTGNASPIYFIEILKSMITI